MVCPAGLIILGGWLLRTRCGLGRWIMIAAIVFGVFAGLYSMFHFLLTAARTMDPTAPRLPMFRHLTKRRMIRMEPVNESTSGSLKWLVLPTLAAEIVLSGIMLGCYALFAALRQDILLGAALGTAAALVNFAAMILGLLRASKRKTRWPPSLRPASCLWRAWSCCWSFWSSRSRASGSTCWPRCCRCASCGWRSWPPSWYARKRREFPLHEC